LVGRTEPGGHGVDVLLLGVDVLLRFRFHFRVPHHRVVRVGVRKSEFGLRP
jgi:hypothetical protein